MRIRTWTLTTALAFVPFSSAFAADTLDTGDTAWITVATAIYSAVATLIVVYIARFVTGGLRVKRDNEIEGLDSAIHGERGFEIQEV